LNGFIWIVLDLLNHQLVFGIAPTVQNLERREIVEIHHKIPQLTRVARFRFRVSMISNLPIVIIKRDKILSNIIQYTTQP
jgi:hypothetical protein